MENMKGETSENELDITEEELELEISGIVLLNQNECL